MSTSTYALPAQAAFFPNSHHERSSTSSPTGANRSRPSLTPGTASPSAEAGILPRATGSTNNLHPVRRASAQQQYRNALGISEIKSKGMSSIDSADDTWVKSNGGSRGQWNPGRRPSQIQTEGLTYPTSPPTGRTPLSARPNGAFDEVFNGILLPLPFLLASLAFPPPHVHPLIGPELEDGQVAVESEAIIIGRRHTQFVHAGTLSAAALLLMGIVARLRLSDTVLDKRKGASPRVASKTSKGFGEQSSFQNVRQVVLRMLGVALPFYASMQLGGLHVALVLLTAIGTGMSAVPNQASVPLIARLRARGAACGLLALLVVIDLTGIIGRARLLDLVPGYLALFASALAVPLPIPYLDRLLGRAMPIIPPSSTRASAGPTPPATPRMSSSKGEYLLSPVVDANISLAAGFALMVITAVASSVFATPLTLTSMQFAFSTLALVCTTGLAFFSLPITMWTKGKPGAASGFILTAIFAFLQRYDIFDSIIIPFIFAALCAAGYAVSVMAAAPDISQFRDAKRPSHKHCDHSWFTGYLLTYCAPGSMLDTILSKRDSRRIAYFACLNLAFMLVQFFYGFVTGSLGLLTDSIHMLFDCLGLAVGLAAAVMSKWPPSLAFPYGYGKVDTLSGFANGIFLILVSIEIITDAVHRLHEGHELRRLNELLVISTLGFLVNVIGLTAFGHAHHGHGHDHGHSHSHAHNHTHTNGHTHHDEKENHRHEHDKHDHHHEHSHDHSHDHSKCNGHRHEESQPSSLPSMPNTPFSIPSLPPPTPNPPSPVKAAHSHNHENENMQGIFLHVLADTLGSVAVIFSTLLTKYDGWEGWDPLASCAIAILIFLSAIPLVKSSGMKLLMALPNEVEYSCRETLQGLSELRGVVGYAGVRVWQEEKTGGGGGHHHHGHSHSHDHSHDAAEKPKLTGVIHVIAAPSADIEDVGERASLYLKGRGLDLIVHIEMEGKGNCWCRGASRAAS